MLKTLFSYAFIGVLWQEVSIKTHCICFVLATTWPSNHSSVVTKKNDLFAQRFYALLNVEYQPRHLSLPNNTQHIQQYQLQCFLSRCEC